MLKTAVFLLLPFLGTGAHMVAQNQDNQRLIDLLKKTLVSDIEAGLPEDSFDSWFGGLVKPAEIDYEVQECTRQRHCWDGRRPHGSLRDCLYKAVAAWLEPMD